MPNAWVNQWIVITFAEKLAVCVQNKTSKKFGPFSTPFFIYKSQPQVIPAPQIFFGP
jgi:hypothetical protein